MDTRDPRVLVINPGSTTTKLAVYEGEALLAQSAVRHLPEEFADCAGIHDQKEARTRRLLDFLRGQGIDPEGLDAVVGRGGLLRPVVSGTYAVNETMLRDLTSDAAGAHASSLGGIMAAEIAKRYGIPAYIVDPVVVDELEPVARLSGIPGLERRSVFHALNAKAVARECADALGIRYEKARFIIAHMGGGISVGAHRLGRVVDVNNALDGEGPFSPERCGSVPLRHMIERCYSGIYTKQEMLDLLSKTGGMIAYLKTNDMLEAEDRIQHGDEWAALVVEAMAYQVSKEIGAMAVALDGRADAIVLTGGLARSERFAGMIRRRVEWIAPVLSHPGEEEMRALAKGALRVLLGQEKALNYPEGGNAGEK